MMRNCFAREIELGSRGRKRKSGRRHPSGNLVREKRPDDRVRTGRQPHRRSLPEADRMSEKAESPLGRLNLKHVISDEEFEAGQRYARDVGTYRASIGAPATTAGSGRRRHCLADVTATADTCRAYPEDCACLRAKQRYDDLLETLSGAGQRAAKNVASAAVQAQDIRFEEIVYLRAGLRILAHFYGLTGRGARA
jgi:hypothetical protein